MVDSRFIEKIVRHHNFKVDIFPLYGDRIRIEFYDGDSIGIGGMNGGSFRIIYEYSLKTPSSFAYKFTEFISCVYLMVYDHFVNHMMTNVDEFKYVWDLFVKEFNEDIIVKVRESIIGLRNGVVVYRDINVDMGYILLPSYHNFMVLLYEHYYNSEKPVNKIAICQFIPEKYGCGEYLPISLEFDLSNI